MNNKYTIRVGHPLVRPGIEIETEASEKYLVPVVQNLMQAVREINGEQVPEISSSTIRDLLTEGPGTLTGLDNATVKLL